jgi:NitT/TauT family transport system substrate-binding protein
MGLRVLRDERRRTRGRRTPRCGIALAFVLAAVAATGCGGGSSSGSGSGSGSKGTTEVRVGFLPAIDLAYLWRAEDQGYFKEEGLDVRLQPMSGGAAITPALVGGSLDVGISDPVSVLVARGHNLDVKFFAFHRFDTPAAPDIYVMAKDGGVSGPAGLVGKTLTSNVLNNQVQLVGEEWLKAAGVDPGKVKFVEVGFPDVNQALENGTVTAASTLDPFKTLGETDGLRVIGRPYDAVRKEAGSAVLPVGGLTTTGKYAAAHPDVLRRFRAAVAKAFKDMADPAVQREVLERHLQIKPAVANKITPIDYGNPVYSQQPTSSMLDIWKKLAVEHQLVPAGLDLSQAVVQG